MIDVEGSCHPWDMTNPSEVEPKDRLRLAREAAGMSRQQLADRRRVSASTVGAHENGQNGITPEAAAAYAKVLNVAPEWILFGHAPGHAAPSGEFIGTSVREVPVAGEIRAGNYMVPIDDRALGWLPFWLPRKYQGVRPAAYHIFGPSRGYRDGAGSFAVVAQDTSLRPRTGDHVVVKAWRGDAVETTLHEVSRDGNELTLAPLSTIARFQTPLTFNDLSPPADLEVVGVVIGTLWIRPENN